MEKMRPVAPENGLSFSSGNRERTERRAKFARLRRGPCYLHSLSGAKIEQAECISNVLL